MSNKFEAAKQIYKGGKYVFETVVPKIAKNLKDRRYHQRVVKSKKEYDRRLHKIKSRDSEREMSDV